MIFQRQVQQNPRLQLEGGAWRRSRRPPRKTDLPQVTADLLFRRRATTTRPTAVSIAVTNDVVTPRRHRSLILYEYIVQFDINILDILQPYHVKTTGHLETTAVVKSFSETCPILVLPTTGVSTVSDVTSF